MRRSRAIPGRNAGPIHIEQDGQEKSAQDQQEALGYHVAGWVLHGVRRGHPTLMSFARSSARAESPPPLPGNTTWFNPGNRRSLPIRQVGIAGSDRPRINARRTSKPFVTPARAAGQRKWEEMWLTDKAQAFNENLPPPVPGPGRDSHPHPRSSGEGPRSGPLAREGFPGSLVPRQL